MARKRLTRQEQKAVTRERLLAAAEKVFAERGYHAASVEDIAEEAGFSIGAVYSNFESKDELFFALVEQCTETGLRATSEIFEAAELSPEARIQAGGRAFIEYMSQERDHWLVFMEFWSSAVRDPELRRKFSQYSDALVANFTEIVDSQCKKLGLVSSTPPEQMAVALAALSDGFMLAKLISPDSLSDEFYESMFSRFIFALVAPLEEDRILAVAQGSALSAR